MSRHVGILGLALVLALGGCTVPSAEPVVEGQEWRQIDLPDGFVGSQLLEVDGRLVVGGSQDDVPAILVADDSGMLAPIPVEAVTFYGGLARWYSLTADGEQLRALGGRTGGGHGNPRWSTWVGDLESLAERNTPGIEVFGGWRGGGMVGVTSVDGQGVIVGGRAGDAPGLDIAVWLEQDGAWIEQSSTGTPLGATDGMLPFPTSVVSDDSRLLITGFRQLLGGGEVRVAASAWIGEPAGPWTLLDLPSDAEESQADAASCDVDGCVIVGRGDGTALAWSYAAGEVRALDLPTLTPGSAVVPAPVAWGGATALVVADGSTAVLAVSNDLRDWTLRAGPAGVPIAAAAVDGSLVVLTEADGVVTLWSSV